jgi:2,3-bisphosphoglycerate-independent phosphoglycerate mutase
MGDLELKMQAIADFDAKIIAPVLKALAGQPIRFALLPDHPVPIELRQHTVDPVPLAICGPGIKSDNIHHYSEIASRSGSLGLMRGDQLMRMLLNLPK